MRAAKFTPYANATVLGVPEENTFQVVSRFGMNFSLQHSMSLAFCMEAVVYYLGDAGASAKIPQAPELHYYIQN